MCTRSVMLHLTFSVKVEEQLGSPVDLYLEGQDQHRGWYGSQTWHAVRARVHSNALQLYGCFGVTFHCRFQSSLITSVAVNDRAPYKSARGQVVVIVIEGNAVVNLQKAI